MHARKRSITLERDKEPVPIDLSRLRRPHLAGLQTYRPGKPIEEVTREYGLTDVVKLASNENPLGTPPAAIDAVMAAARGLSIYPDGYQFRLKQRVAALHGVAPERVFIGNGSDEIITLIAWTYLGPGDEGVTSEMAFVRYAQVTAVASGTPVHAPQSGFRYDLDAVARAITPRSKVVFIANPNNPTGTMVGREEVRTFLARIPRHLIVVFDEAYFDFVDDPDYPDSLAIAREFPDRAIVTLRTFSKNYGLAGLRVGYGIMPPEMVGHLNVVRGPFNVNTPAQDAALACLEDRDFPRRGRELVKEELPFLYREYDRLGLRYVRSHGNFVLVDTGRDGESVYQALLRRGVIVRPIAGFDFPPGLLRISVGTPAQNRRLIAALEPVLREVEPSVRPSGSSRPEIEPTTRGGGPA